MPYTYSHGHSPNSRICQWRRAANQGSQSGSKAPDTNHPRMVPPKRKGDLELRRKSILNCFYFMKSDVGSLALLDIFLHGEESVFWMVYFWRFLGHLALGTYHLCLRISALVFDDVCWISPFISMCFRAT